MNSLPCSDYQFTHSIVSTSYRLPVIGHCIDCPDSVTNPSVRRTTETSSHTSRSSVPSPETTGPCVHSKNQADSRLSVRSRGPRNQSLAERRRAAGMDLPSLRSASSPASLCHFQLRDVRRSSRQTSSEDRSTATGKARITVRRNHVPFPSLKETGTAGARPCVAEQSRVDLGFAIWLLRKSQSLTQGQVAKRVRTSRQQFGAWEIGRVPKVATLLRVSKALNVSPETLFAIAEARGKHA